VLQQQPAARRPKEDSGVARGAASWACSFGASFGWLRKRTFENFASHATDDTRRDKAWDRAQSIRSLVSTYASIARYSYSYFAILLSESGWERNKVLADFNLRVATNTEYSYA
jgi:hypothetical protein